MNRQLLLYGLMALLTGMAKATNNNAESSLVKFNDLGPFDKNLKGIAPRYNALGCKVLSVIADSSYTVPKEAGEEAAATQGMPEKAFSSTLANSHSFNAPQISEWETVMESVAEVVNKIQPDFIDVIKFSNYARGVVGPQKFTQDLLDTIRHAPHMDGGGTEMSSALILLLNDLPKMLQDPKVQNLLLIFSDFDVNEADRPITLQKMAEILNKYPGVSAWCMAINADLEFAKEVCGDNVIPFNSIEELRNNWDRIPKLTCIEDATSSPTVSPTESTDAPTTRKPTRVPTQKTSKPTHQPITRGPSTAPTNSPSYKTTTQPSQAKTKGPTHKPTSHKPTKHPTTHPTGRPSLRPSSSPTASPTTVKKTAAAFSALWLLLLLLSPCARPKHRPGNRLQDQADAGATQPLLTDEEVDVEAGIETQTNRDRVRGGTSQEESYQLRHGIHPILGDRNQVQVMPDEFLDRAGRQGPQRTRRNTNVQEIIENVSADEAREVYASILLVSIYAYLTNAEQLRIKGIPIEGNITPFVDGIRQYFGYRGLGPEREMVISHPFNPLVPQHIIANEREEEYYARLRQERVQRQPSTQINEAGEEFVRLDGDEGQGQLKHRDRFEYTTTEESEFTDQPYSDEEEEMLPKQHTQSGHKKHVDTSKMKKAVREEEEEETHYPPKQHQNIYEEEEKQTHTDEVESNVEGLGLSDLDVPSVHMIEEDLLGDLESSSQSQYKESPKKHMTFSSRQDSSSKSKHEEPKGGSKKNNRPPPPV